MTNQISFSTIGLDCGDDFVGSGITSFGGIGAETLASDTATGGSVKVSEYSGFVPSSGLLVSSETVVSVFSLTVDFQLSPACAVSSLLEFLTVTTWLLSTILTCCDNK